MPNSNINYENSNEEKDVGKVFSLKEIINNKKSQYDRSFKNERVIKIIISLTDRVIFPIEGFLIIDFIKSELILFSIKEGFNDKNLIINFLLYLNNNNIFRELNILDQYPVFSSFRYKEINLKSLLERIDLESSVTLYDREVVVHKNIYPYGYDYRNTNIVQSQNLFKFLNNNLKQVLAELLISFKNALDVYENYKTDISQVTSLINIEKYVVNLNYNRLNLIKNIKYDNIERENISEIQKTIESIRKLYNNTTYEKINQINSKLNKIHPQLTFYYKDSRKLKLKAYDTVIFETNCFYNYSNEETNLKFLVAILKSQQTYNKIISNLNALLIDQL